MCVDIEYIFFVGYWIYMVYNDVDDQWYFEGIYGDLMILYKCCMVFGGGKLEIFKVILDIFLWGNVYFLDFEVDMDVVDDILYWDYLMWFVDFKFNGIDYCLVFLMECLVGLVIKFFILFLDFIDWYNDWINLILVFCKELVFIIKCYYKLEWGDDWCFYFSVVFINGCYGNMVCFDGQKVLVSMVCVGFQFDGLWWLFILCYDYVLVVKV